MQKLLLESDKHQNKIKYSGYYIKEGFWGSTSARVLREDFPKSVIVKLDPTLVRKRTCLRRLW